MSFLSSTADRGWMMDQISKICLIQALDFLYSSDILDHLELLDHLEHSDHLELLDLCLKCLLGMPFLSSIADRGWMMDQISKNLTFWNFWTFWIIWIFWTFVENVY